MKDTLHVWKVCVVCLWGIEVVPRGQFPLDVCDSCFKRAVPVGYKDVVAHIMECRICMGLTSARSSWTVACPAGAELFQKMKE